MEHQYSVDVLLFMLLKEKNCRFYTLSLSLKFNISVTLQFHRGVFL